MHHNWTLSERPKSAPLRGVYTPALLRNRVPQFLWLIAGMERRSSDSPRNHGVQQVRQVPLKVTAALGVSQFSSFGIRANGWRPCTREVVAPQLFRESRFSCCI